jgi:hypothetical protein
MRYKATAALPYDNLERATSGLQGELRHALALVQKAPDWSTLEVDGPTEVKGASGRTWYRWTASVEPK